MTTTSEERIEIAAKVRHANGISAFVSALGIDVDSDWCWTDVSWRVAELIDPTCHEVGSWCESGLYYPTIYHHELSCGHTITTPYGALPEYCDECGARILDYD